VNAEFVEPKDTKQQIAGKILKKERKKAAGSSNTANLTFPTAPTGFPTANAASADTPKMICTYCNKEGHTEDRSFKKQRDRYYTQLPKLLSISKCGKCSINVL
jgi:hypothetical protein